jgi:phage-related protein
MIGARAGLAVRFYRSLIGNEPVREWLRAQGRGIRNAIGKRIRAVQQHWPVGRPLVGSFGAGLFEVRVQFEGSAYRVMFIVLAGSEMVLLHIFQKKTRATPKGDLETARQRQKEATS